MRVLICGDRNWDDRPLFDEAMHRFVERHGIPELVIEGCARGADAMAERWAQENGVRVQHHPANWQLEHRAAGPIRNQRMLNAKPDYVIAFHANLPKSKGTAHMVRIARRAGVPVWLAATEALG